MLVGYARVSKHEQNLDLQIDALVKAGCEQENIYTDKVSSIAAHRPQLELVLNNVLRQGDILVVYRLDRLGRTLKNLIEIVTDLNNKNIGFKSITNDIDTSSANGMLQFHMFAAFAEFERNLLVERTKAGLEAAKARGRLGGRPRILGKEKAKALKKLHSAKTNTVKELCAMFNISRTAFYNAVKTAD